ncbi:MAG: 4Fe-4S binding protein [Dehalococcoidia bacterium]
MAKGEIVINEALCKGCGYCVKFCNQGCIEFSKDRISALGNPIAVVVHPDKCTACAMCGWMCPDYAITVYKYVADKAPATK